MTLFYVLLIIAPFALVLASLVNTGNSSSIKEAMERRGVGTKQAAPVAPKTKFAPVAAPVAPVAVVAPVEAAEPTLPIAA